MGWSNYIIIEDWKMVIETNRSVEDIEDYISDALDKMIDDDIDIDVNISDLKVNDITIKNLCILASAYDSASSLSQLDTDKLFLYWLKNRDIEYIIKSEFTIDIKEYKKNGYNVIRLSDSHDQCDDEQIDDNDKQIDDNDKHIDDNDKQII